MSHIAVSKNHFLSILLKQFDSDNAKQRFGKLASCIEALFYVNRIAKIEAFKQCYSSFSDRRALSFKDSSLRQSTLMHMIYTILTDAHFEAITLAMYKNAAERAFVSDFPIKVDYTQLDATLFTEFYKQFPSQNPYATLQHKPPFHDHFAMFHRGCGLKTMNGLFIAPKVNIFFNDLLALFQSTVSHQLSHCVSFVGAVFFNDPSFLNPAGSNTENAPKPQNNITLQRISLSDTYHAAKAKGFTDVLWWFLSNIQIQEPTFERVVVIYSDIHAKTHPIRIQYFCDIPMSDVEITYPATQFSLQPVHELYVICSVLVGIWMLLFATSTVMGYCTVVAALAWMIRSLVWYRVMENDYVRALNESLIESNISCDQDTILSLVDSVGDQQFMETLLAYFVISRDNDLTDSEGVDRACERWMERLFGDNAQFRIHGAMNKLSELGLIQSSGRSKRDAIKVKEALDALSCVQSHYKSSIQTLRKVPVPRVLTCPETAESVRSKPSPPPPIHDYPERKAASPPIVFARQIPQTEAPQEEEPPQEEEQKAVEPSESELEDEEAVEAVEAVDAPKEDVETPKEPDELETMLANLYFNS